MIRRRGFGSFREVGAREAEAAPGSRLGKCEVREFPELLGLLRVTPPPPGVISAPRRQPGGPGELGATLVACPAYSTSTSRRRRVVAV